VLSIIIRDASKQLVKNCKTARIPKDRGFSGREVYAQGLYNKKHG